MALSLSSCPFCGSNKVEVSFREYPGHGDCTHVTYVVCKSCNATGPNKGDYGKYEHEEDEIVIDLWNNRLGNGV